ncbi:MAG: FG-GAP repeat protein, partial [Persicimonas sp.]
DTFHSGHYGSRFGSSVDVSGSIIAVGAPWFHSNDYGAVYMFEQTASGWSKVQRVERSPIYSNTYFGGTVALDGSTMAVGHGTRNGGVFIFENTASGWTQVEHFTGSKRFGVSLALEGDTLAVGHSRSTQNEYTDGAVFIYEKNSSGWAEVQTLAASDGQAADYFGTSVAMDGSTLVVGAEADEDNGPYSGSAYVFEKTASGWVEVQKITPSDGREQGRFGSSVALLGDKLVVGARTDDENGFAAGASYIFESTASGWVEQQKLHGSNTDSGDRFGYSVALQTDTLIVGARYAGPNAYGQAYVFEPSAASWTEVQRLDNASSTSDEFGYALAADPDTAVIAARKPTRMTTG